MSIKTFMLLLLKCIAVPIVGIYLTVKFNPFVCFHIFSFIPITYRFSTCITLYYAILDLIITVSINQVKRSGAKIAITFYTDKDNINIKDTPCIVFPPEDVATIQLDIYISGKARKFNNTSIHLPFPGWIGYQMVPAEKGISEVYNTAIIYLDKLYNRKYPNNVIDSHLKFFIPVIRNDNNAGNQYDLHPEIRKKHMLTIFESNSIKLKN